jgi:hypothetical protein
MMTFFMIIICIVMFLLSMLLIFVLDDIVLNKHFTKKLHRKIGVDK